MGNDQSHRRSRVETSESELSESDSEATGAGPPGSGLMRNVHGEFFDPNDAGPSASSRSIPPNVRSLSFHIDNLPDRTVKTAHIHIYDSPQHLQCTCVPGIASRRCRVHARSNVPKDTLSMQALQYAIRRQRGVGADRQTLSDDGTRRARQLFNENYPRVVRNRASSSPPDPQGHSQRERRQGRRTRNRRRRGRRTLSESDLNTDRQRQPRVGAWRRPLPRHRSLREIRQTIDYSLTSLRRPIEDSNLELNVAGLTSAQRYARNRENARRILEQQEQMTIPPTGHCDSIEEYLDHLKTLLRSLSEPQRRRMMEMLKQIRENLTYFHSFYLHVNEVVNQGANPDGFRLTDEMSQESVSFEELIVVIRGRLEQCMFLLNQICELSGLQ